MSQLIHNCNLGGATLPHFNSLKIAKKRPRNFGVNKDRPCNAKLLCRSGRKLTGGMTTRQ
ncbi:hypothetical protein [Flagellimonas marinaquae]